MNYQGWTLFDKVLIVAKSKVTWIMQNIAISSQMSGKAIL